MKLKVLHIINALTPDGAENLLVNSLAPGGLQEYANNILVYFAGTSPIEHRVDKAVKIICLNYKGIFDLPRTLLQLRHIIKEYKIDIVHSHLNPASFYTRVACPANVKQVHTMHSIYSMNTQTPFIKLFLERELLLKKQNCNLIFLTDFAEEDFLRSVNFKGKSFVLNNFIQDDYFTDTVKEYAADRNTLKMVAVGRLVKLKNFEYLLEAFKYLKDKEIYLDIYGDGNIAEYEEKIKAAGLRVSMKGHNYHLYRELKNYDLYIMPSKYEGFGLALFEAMAAGVPVMASDIAPLRSIAKDNAIYFELDDAKKLADTIISIFEHQTAINALAKKARVYAEETVRRERYIKKLLEIYATL